MSRGVFLNESEWEALAGLPALQFRLYLVLRWWMDGRSRTVGRVGKTISRAMLAEWCYVEPAQGRHREDTGSPSEKAIRSALSGLEKAGLIVDQHGHYALIFFMPLATGAQARPKYEGPMRGREDGPMTGHVFDNDFSGLESYPQDDGQTGFGYEGPTSRVYVNPISVVNAAAPARVVAAVAGGVLPGEYCHALRAWEAERGRIGRFVETHETPVGWARDGVSLLTLREAYDRACAARDRDGSGAPVNFRFVHRFVEEVRSGRAKAAPGEWWRSSRGLETRAAELGLMRAEGEQYPMFRERVLRAAGVVNRGIGQLEGGGVPAVSREKTPSRRERSAAPAGLGDVLRGEPAQGREFWERVAADVAAGRTVPEASRRMAEQVLGRTLGGPGDE